MKRALGLLLLALAWVQAWGALPVADGKIEVLLHPLPSTVTW